MADTVFATHASGTLTSSGVFTNAQTVTIGTRVYTSVTAIGSAAGNFLIGANAAASLQNLHDCINSVGNSNANFIAFSTPDPTVRAIRVTATTLVVQAKVPGLVGNFIPTADTQTNASWGGATLAGGTGDIAVQGLPHDEMLRP